MADDKDRKQCEAVLNWPNAPLVCELQEGHEGMHFFQIKWDDAARIGAVEIEARIVG